MGFFGLAVIVAITVTITTGFVNNNKQLTNQVATNTVTNRQEVSKPIQSDNDFVGVWSGNWNGWNTKMNLNQDGTGFIQDSAYSGTNSYDIVHWGVKGSKIEIRLPDKSSGTSDRGGYYQLNNGKLSIKHSIVGWTIYSKE